jgi:RNA polymerase sigma factor (sigma-70 family)
MRTATRTLAPTTLGGPTLTMSERGRRMTGAHTGEADFAALIEAARRRAPWALEQVYTSLAPAVAGMLRAQGAAEPDDLTSEVFVGVLRNLDAFEGDAAGFRSWVFTIAYRRLADERRRQRRRPPPEPLDLAEDVPATVDVEDDVARAMAAHGIRRLCDRLTPGQRDVLLLRLFGRVTVVEVARALDMTPAAVKGLQRRGYETILRLLGNEEVER